VKRFLLPVLVALATSSEPTSAQLGGLVSSGVVQRVAKKALPGPGNVLLILADDVGVDGIGAYGVGGDLPHTPRLDQLAAGGVLFRNAWANPVCSPTRATIQTGRYSIRTGIGWIAEPAPTLIGLPLSEVTLPEMLDLGTGGAWAHAAFGKWHLGDGPDVGGVFAPNLAGYYHFEGTLGNVTDYYDWTKVENGVVTQETGTYALSDQVDSALDWIATAPEPWFCYVAFNSAHSPWHAPPPDLHSVDLSGAGDPEVDPRP
jgi:arylsulfatase A-like enzyme